MTGRYNPRDPRVARDPVHGFKFYVDPPHIGMHELAAVGAVIVLPPDGGWWIVDALTGIRYRRITMADLPKHVTWHTRGKGRYADDDQDGEIPAREGTGEPAYVERPSPRTRTG